MLIKCGRCGKPLKDVNSRAIGFGKICAEKMGIQTTFSSGRKAKRHKGYTQLSLEMSGEKSTTKCDFCGREIKFIHIKKEQKNIDVNFNHIFFVSPYGEGAEEFITATGQLVQGNRSQDGMKGYIRHKCH